MSEQAREALAGHIDAIEGAYEFFLAYAAQGITRHGGSQNLISQAVRHLDEMHEAVVGLAPALDGATSGEGAVQGLEAFGAVVTEDARRAEAVVSLVRAQDAISSQLIDNLNASVHIRTLLTDLFILDEVLKLGVDEATLSGASGTPS